MVKNSNFPPISGENGTNIICHKLIIQKMLKMEIGEIIENYSLSLFLSLGPFLPYHRQKTPSY